VTHCAAAAAVAACGAIQVLCLYLFANYSQFITHSMFITVTTSRRSFLAAKTSPEMETDWGTDLLGK